MRAAQTVSNPGTVKHRFERSVATRVGGKPIIITVTFLVGRFGETVPRNGGAHHLKDQVVGVGRLRQQRDQPVELVEGAGPTMDHDQRDGSRSLRHLLGFHVQEVDVDACRETIHSHEARSRSSELVLLKTQCGLTFNFGFELRELVEFVHLSPPVEVVPPVRHHLLQIVGVEAVVELAVLQRGNGPGLVNPPVQVLGGDSATQVSSVIQSIHQTEVMINKAVDD